VQGLKFGHGIGWKLPDSGLGSRLQGVTRFIS
jgi:hypothetical protein